jgi:hypothetical protein
LVLKPTHSVDDLEFIKENHLKLFRYAREQVEVPLRVVFPPRGQRSFMEEVKKRSRLSLRQLFLLYRKRLGVSYSAMKRYRREESLIPLHFVKKLCGIAGLSFESLEIIELLPENWGRIKGGKRGIEVMLLKHREKLREWRAKGGEAVHKNLLQGPAKKAFLPYLNEKLAELIGIHLGDGTLTKYFLKISQDPRYDLLYVSYIKTLVEDLFEVLPAIRQEKGRNLIYIQLFSKTACEYLHNEWNLPYGDKIRGKVAIPDVIMKNRNMAIACLRGLIDTDGSISKDGNSISIRFSSYNKTLVDQVERIGRSLGVFTFRNPMETGTRSWSKVKNYFRIVGSSNLRHIARFNAKFLENKVLKKEEVTKYYKKHKGIHLPFKLGEGP